MPLGCGARLTGRLDVYELQREIGRGTTSRVYLALGLISLSSYVIKSKLRYEC